ncbi:hypothetical protein [Rhizobium sp. NPDC090279]|uniref:hypothetical protein n=1 Tax=Rhizobium sp. NPDC090279 TaxID=3364499 RepID=UPI00383A6E8E
MNGLCAISATIMVSITGIGSGAPPEFGGENVMAMVRPDSDKCGDGDDISSYRSTDGVLIESQYVRKPFRWPWAPGQDNASQSGQKSHNGSHSGDASSGSSNTSGNMGGSSSGNSSTSSGNMGGSGSSKGNM